MNTQNVNTAALEPSWGVINQPDHPGVPPQARSLSVHEAWRVQIQQRSQRSASSSFLPALMCQYFR